MNLVAYDSISIKIDRTKSWIDDKHPLLISRELPKRPYYTFVKRFEPTINETQYYLVLLDDWAKETPSFNTRVDDYGRLKIGMNYLVNHEHIEIPYGCNIKLEHIEHTDDGDIYRVIL